MLVGRSWSYHQTCSLNATEIFSSWFASSTNRRLKTTYSGLSFDHWLWLAECSLRVWVDPRYKDNFFHTLAKYHSDQVSIPVRPARGQSSLNWRYLSDVSRLLLLHSAHQGLRYGPGRILSDIDNCVGSCFTAQWLALFGRCGLLRQS